MVPKTDAIVSRYIRSIPKVFIKFKMPICKAIMLNTALLNRWPDVEPLTTWSPVLLSVAALKQHICLSQTFNPKRVNRITDKAMTNTEIL